MFRCNPDFQESEILKNTSSCNTIEILLTLEVLKIDKPFKMWMLRIPESMEKANAIATALSVTSFKDLPKISQRIHYLQVNVHSCKVFHATILICYSWTIKFSYVII